MSKIFLLFVSTLISMLVLAGSKRWVNSSPDSGSGRGGVNLGGMDCGVNAGDDFFRFTYGNWLRNSADSVRNVDPWYDAFSVKPGQKLYLEPGERARLW